MAEGNYNVTKINTVFGHRAFSVVASLEWNMQTAHIKSIVDKDWFKRALKRQTVLQVPVMVDFVNKHQIGTRFNLILTLLP